MEKVKVPAWVATRLIEDSETHINIDEKIKHCNCTYSNEKYLDDFEKWIVDNPSKYVLAMKCGYEIEEELYYIKICPCDRRSYLNTSKTIGDKTCWTANSNKETGGFKTKFTMDEINTYLPQFKPFAVKVGDEDGCDN
jgi:hypothetical protein